MNAPPIATIHRTSLHGQTYGGAALQKDGNRKCYDQNGPCAAAPE